MLLSDLFESPLPDEWDKTVFSNKTSFKNRLEYLLKNAQKLGKGSSRIAVEIPYNGRMTVLKVACNRKGLAQNFAEANVLGDIYAPSHLIPLIDYDTGNGNTVYWIHTEKAEKMTSGFFKNYFGIDTADFANCYAYRFRNTRYIMLEPDIFNDLRQKDIDKYNLVNEYLDVIHELKENFMVDPREFIAYDNWGVFNDEPVIIDVGYTDESKKAYGH